MNFIKALKHAFSTEEEKLTEPEKKELGELAEKISNSRLKPAIMIFIESVRPLNYIGSQTALGFKPFLELLVNPEKLDSYISILGKRGAISYLIDSIK